MTSIRITAAFLLVLGAARAQSAAAARGDYLTKQVAMCVQCHSPQDHQGKLIEGELFLGAPIPFKEIPAGWATRAPRIARLPGGWTEQDVIRLLQYGERPDGTSPNRPMPPFRMNQEDAAAIAAFLKTVKSSKP
jgi:cytochrome c553